MADKRERKGGRASVSSAPFLGVTFYNHSHNIIIYFEEKKTKEREKEPNVHHGCFPFPWIL